MTLPELREALEDITSFYSEGVIFEGSMARCPWEAGMVIATCSSSSKNNCNPPLPPHPGDRDLKSRWSADSDSEIIFASRSITIESSYGVPWDEYSSGTTWAFESQPPPEEDNDDLFTVLRSARTDSENSLLSPATSTGPSMPSTPNSFDMIFGDRARMPIPQRMPLTINTNFPATGHYYAGNASMGSYISDTSAMQTAVEYDHYSSSFFLATPISPMKMPQPPTIDAGLITEDKEMQSPATLWATSESASVLSRYSSLKSLDSGEISEIPRSSAPSPDIPLWPPSASGHSSDADFYSFPAPARPESPAKKLLEKAKSSSIFNHFHIFTKSFAPSSAPAKTPSDGEKPCSPSFKPFDLRHRWASESPPSHPLSSLSWMNIFSEGLHRPDSGSVKRVETQRSRRRAAYLRSPRHWFLPGKLFASNQE